MTSRTLKKIGNHIIKCFTTRYSTNGTRYSKALFTVSEDNSCISKAKTQSIYYGTGDYGGDYNAEYRYNDYFNIDNDWFEVTSNAKDYYHDGSVERLYSSIAKVSPDDSDSSSSVLTSQTIGNYNIVAASYNSSSGSITSITNSWLQIYKYFRFIYSKNYIGVLIKNGNGNGKQTAPDSKYRLEILPTKSNNIFLHQ